MPPRAGPPTRDAVANPAETMGGVEPFGTRLRRLREAKGLAITALGMRVGLTEAAIRQLEIGRTKDARLADGVRLADALGVDPRYLAFGAGEDPRSELERRLCEVEKRLGISPGAGCCGE